MENCHCGVPFFMITKFINNKKYETRRCGYYLDLKKKKICDYKKDIFISDIEIKKYTNLNSTCITQNTKEDIRVTLNNYIYLYEISSEKGIKTGNISANINFLLNQMKYKLFFDDIESIDDLKKRLCNLPDNIIPIFTFKPINLLGIPEELKPVSNKKFKTGGHNTNFCFINYAVTKNKDIEGENSDSSSDYSENNEFDVENFSDSEYEDYNNFSD